VSPLAENFGVGQVAPGAVRGRASAGPGETKNRGAKRHGWLRYEKIGGKGRVPVGSGYPRA